MSNRTGKTSGKTDEELLSLFRESGRMEYFGELYSRYIPLVYGLSLKYLRHAEKAQDAVMQLYEDLVYKICRYEITTFKSWLYSVAKNHCLQVLKKEIPEITVDFNHLVMESDMICYLFEKGDQEERFEILKKCMEKLPGPQNISITKFFLEEMSYADIVTSTGYTLKSVKSYIQNGKRNLKICIENNNPQ